jgi:uncharacterized membrane protein
VKPGLTSFSVGFKILIVVLLTLGIFFRFANLDKKVYWYDETRTSIRAIAAYSPTAPKAIFDNRITDANDLLQFQRVNPDRSIVDSIKVMASDDPKHPPLYYTLVGLWARAFGDSVATVRAFSAIISLFVFPALYWLCLELFQSTSTGWLAISLMAVSPFQVLYAQEARQYGLWAVAILLSSASLLRAKRSQTKLNWCIYAITLVMGLYTFSLFGLVILAHAIYMLGSSEFQPLSLRTNPWQSLAMATFRSAKLWKNYALATLFGAVSFAPWAKLIYDERDELRLDQLEASRGIVYLLKTWLIGISSVYFDPDSSVMDALRNDTDSLITYLIRLPVLLLIIYAVYYLVKTSKQQIWLLVVSIMSVSGLFLAIPDILVGGVRSSVPRYLVPFYLSTQLAIAYLLNDKLFANPKSYQAIWKGVTSLVITLGVVSCTISYPAETWWNKQSSYHIPEVAHVLNREAHPVLISSYSWYNSTQLLSLSHKLKSHVRLHLLEQPDSSQIVRDRYGELATVFVFNPKPEFQQDLMQAGYELSVVNELGQLWQLEMNSSTHSG